MEWEDLDLCWRAWLRGWPTRLRAGSVGAAPGRRGDDGRGSRPAGRPRPITTSSASRSSAFLRRVAARVVARRAAAPAAAPARDRAGARAGRARAAARSCRRCGMRPTDHELSQRSTDRMSPRLGRRRWLRSDSRRRDGRPSRPARATTLRVLRVIAAAEFKLKYAGSALGYVWSVVKPLALFTMLYARLRPRLQARRDLALLPGLAADRDRALHVLRRRDARSAMFSLVARESLLRKLAFPRIDHPDRGDADGRR